MISSGFLHADWVHLLLNMYVLYSFSQGVISTFGNFSFWLIYFGSLLFGSLLTLTIYKNDYSYSAVGASGAVTGIVYASIWLFPESTVGVFFLLPMPSYVFGVLYLVYSIYGMKAQNDGIGHAAHFGGAVGGLVLTVITNARITSNRTLVNSWVISSNWNFVFFNETRKIIIGIKIDNTLIKKRSIMKKLILLATLVSTNMTNAQEVTKIVPQVSVTGQGKIKVKPDQVSINFGVENLGKDATEVKKLNDETVDKVMKFIKKFGIPTSRTATPSTVPLKT